MEEVIIRDGTKGEKHKGKKKGETIDDDDDKFDMPQIEYPEDK